MDKTLIVAQATFDRAAAHIAAIAAGMSAVLLLGGLILSLGLPGWLAALAILAVLVGLALVKARFGPPEIRVDRPDEGAVPRVAGRLAGAVIGDKQRRPIERAVIADDGDLRLELADDGAPAAVWLRQPSFKADSLALLAALINDMRELPREELRARYRERDRKLKIYDAKNMLLLRFTERPSYMAMTWLVAGVTVLFWLFLLPLLVGG